MNKKFHVPKIFETLVPFLIAGIALSLLIGLLIMFSYVVIWGIIIGGVLWLFSLVKQVFSPGPTKTRTSEKKSHGRIIEHDDKK